MAKNRKHVVPFRRKQDRRTNYQLRLKLLMSRQPRLVVRASNKHILAQIVTYHPDGDKVDVGVSTRNLAAFGWTGACANTSAAYLCGLLLAKKAKAQKIEGAIADLGSQVSRKGTRIYAVIKGVQDGGFNVPCSPDMFPSEDRINGKHVEAYATASDQFVKTKTAAQSMSSLVQKTKQAIMK